MILQKIMNLRYVHIVGQENGNTLALLLEITCHPEFASPMKGGKVFFIGYFSRPVTKIIEIGKLILCIYSMFKEHVASK